MTVSAPGPGLWNWQRVDIVPRNSLQAAHARGHRPKIPQCCPRGPRSTPQPGGRAVRIRRPYPAALKSSKRSSRKSAPGLRRAAKGIPKSLARVPDLEVRRAQQITGHESGPICTDGSGNQIQRRDSFFGRSQNPTASGIDLCRHEFNWEHLSLDIRRFSI